MRALIKFVLWLVIVYVVLMVGSGLLAKALLSKSQIQSVLAVLEGSVPVKIEAGGGTFDLIEWLQFRPSITLEQIAIGNPPGFSSEHLLTASSLAAQVSLLSLFSDQIEIERFTLVEPNLRIEQGRGGQTNLEALIEAVGNRREKRTPDAAPKEGPASKGVKVGGLSLRSGTVEYLREGNDPLVVENINFNVDQFSVDRASNVNIAATVLGSDTSQVTFEGTAGPFGGERLPADGRLSVDLRPGDIPTEFRRQYFGDLLSDPGSSSQALVSAAMKGDLLGEFRGDGSITISDLMVGGNPDSRLPLDGELPLQLEVSRPLGGPSFTVQSENAALQVGQGSWKGNAEVRYNGREMRGNSRGSISGVRIDELIKAFATGEDLLFGLGEVPAYQISFRGATAEEIRDSLSGQGNVRLDEGRIAFFNLIDTIEKHANKLLDGAGAAEGITPFANFKSDLQVIDQRLQFSGIELVSGSTQITGSGYITFDRELHFDLLAGVSGPLAALFGGLAGSDQMLDVPVRIRGTSDNPEVRPDVGKVAKEKVTKTVTGLLDSWLGGGKTAPATEEDSPKDTPAEPVSK